MRRIALSLILGLFLPFILYATIGITTDYMPPSALTEIRFYGQSAPGILLAPFSLPIYLDIFLKQKRIAPFIFDTFLFTFSSFILFNWGLYGFLIYLILGRFKRFRKHEISYSEKPPAPTEFEQLQSK